MSRVTRSHPLEFGATEPHPQGFVERGSFLSELLSLGRMFRSSADPQEPEDLSLPRALGEVPRPAAGPAAVEEPIPAAAVQASPERSLAPLDEIERLVLHVAASDRPARAQRILVTHLPATDQPLARLDCASFATQLARALSLEGRAILVVLREGSGQALGLSDLVAGSASFSEAIHREAGSRLHILPPGRAQVAPGTPLGVVMEALAETYDFLVLAVLLDDPEAAHHLALSLAPRADHAIIACSGQAASPDLLAWRERLLGAGAGDVLAARIDKAASGAELAA